MTPQEAVAELVNTGAIATLESEAGVARTLIDACVATAKAEAKADETRRCAGICDALGELAAEADDAPSICCFGDCYKAILRTGGLEVEE